MIDTKTNKLPRAYKRFTNYKAPDEVALTYDTFGLDGWLVNKFRGLDAFSDGCFLLQGAAPSTKRATRVVEFDRIMKPIRDKSMKPLKPLVAQRKNYTSESGHYIEHVMWFDKWFSIDLKYFDFVRSRFADAEFRVLPADFNNKEAVCLIFKDSYAKVACGAIKGCTFDVPEVVEMLREET